ncbi:retrovirus-related pol polyprotein from transposon TNT 1-94 [Tanacetum coccineum]
MDSMQQPMSNPEDITDPTTTMNMALVLMAKAFKLNYSTPTNNNQIISSNPRNRQIAQPGMNIGQDRQMQMVRGNGGNQFRQYVGQNVGNQNRYHAVQNVGHQVVQNAVQNLGVQNAGNQNGIIVIPGIANQNSNQFGNGNVVATRVEGNANGNNGNQIRCYNCRGLGYFARNCTVRPRRRDATYLQTQLLIAQKEEARIQLQAKEFDLMAAAVDLGEIEEVNANCILMANLQQASTSGTSTDNAPVYDSDGLAEVHNYNNCYDDEIFNMFTQEEQYTKLIEPISEPHQVQQNDSNVISDVPRVEQNGGIVEQSPTTVEETRALYDSLYNNLAIEVEKVNSVNRKMKATNAELITELARYKNQEKLFEINQEKYDKLERCYLKPVYQEQCFTKKINALHLSSEKKRLKSDFKIREDELLDTQIQLENKIKELDNILVKTDTSNLQTKLERMKEHFENCIIKKETEYAKLWNDWYKKCNECKYDKILYDKAYNDMQQKIERLQAQLGDLKGKCKDTPGVSNTLNPLSQKLENENVELEFQVVNYVSERKDTTKGTSANTKFANQSILGKPVLQPIRNNFVMRQPNAFKSERPKFSNNRIPQKVDQTNDLSKLVISNLVLIIKESNVVKNDNVIAPGMFRIDHRKTVREDKFVPINKNRASIRTNPITVSQPHVEVEEHHRNVLLSKNKKHMSSECNNVKLAIRNDNSEVVCAIWSKERLASSKPRKPRSYLRWSPTGRMFDRNGKLIESSDAECHLDYLNGENACPSNHQEHTRNQFPNSTLSLAGTVCFGNDHITAILGYGDLQWGNILITRVYFVEGLGHNLFLVGQFCDSDLEVTFRRNTCFIKNLEGVDLLKGNRTTNLHNINLHEMASASPIFLMVHATSTKSWLWHQRLSHLNFDTINDLARNDLVTGLPKFKYHKEHLCPSCEQRKSKRASHPPKPVPNSKQRSNDEAPEVIKTFLKTFQVLLQASVIVNDREDIGKLGAKGNIGFFIGYSANSRAYKVYNQRTKKIMKTMNVTFDELLTMAFEQSSSKPGLQGMTSGQISSGLDLTYAPSTITTQQPTEVLQTPTTSTSIADTTLTPTNSSSQATNIPSTSQDVDELKTQQQHVQQQDNEVPLQPTTVDDNVSNAMLDGNQFVNPFATPSTSAAESSSSQYVDPSNMHMFYQPYHHKYQ